MFQIVQPPWLTWIVVFAACVDPSTGDVLCVDLYPSECEGQSTCMTLTAYGVLGTDDAPCADYTGDPVGVGCDNGGRACTEESTLAAPPDDPSDCFLFIDSCTPADWVACEDLSDIPPEC